MEFVVGALGGVARNEAISAELRLDDLAERAVDEHGVARDERRLPEPRRKLQSVRAVGVGRRGRWRERGRQAVDDPVKTPSAARLERRGHRIDARRRTVGDDDQPDVGAGQQHARQIHVRGARKLHVERRQRTNRFARDDRAHDDTRQRRHHALIVSNEKLDRERLGHRDNDYPTDRRHSGSEPSSIPGSVGREVRCPK